MKNVFVSFKVCYTATSISLSKQGRGGRRVIFPLATAAIQPSPTNIQALAFYRWRHKKTVVLKNKKDADELNMFPSYLLLFGSDVMRPMILPQNVILF